jgi:starch synthase (maltosyl-transferring)
VNDARRGIREEVAPVAVIENVTPRVDGGRFAAKRVVGEEVTVTADGFAHGHEKVACALRWRGPGDGVWSESAMEFLGNDRWRGSFTVDRIGRGNTRCRAGSITSSRGARDSCAASIRPTFALRHAWARNSSPNRRRSRKASSATTSRAWPRSSRRSRIPRRCGDSPATTC